MELPKPVASLIEGLLRRRALRAAVAKRDQGGKERRAALDQARLLVEIGRRVAEPAETLPRGSRPAALLLLYRNAVRWALRAEAPGTADQPLADAWESAPRERLRAAAGDDAKLQEVRSLLTNWPEAGALDATASQAELLRSFTEALVYELDAPERDVQRLEVQRYTRLGLSSALLAALVFGVPYLLRGPDLARDRPFKLSSVYGGCDEAGKCGELMFHTQIEPEPWVTFDLGAERTLRSVELKNRTDCCSERAVPLAVELSGDDRSFTEVARRQSNFTTWRASFKARKARYVRLRSLHTTALHLENVQIR